MKSMKNKLITLLSILTLGNVAHSQTKTAEDVMKTDSTKTTQTTQKEEKKDNFSGNIELIKSVNPDHSYIRPNTFYSLPGGINGFNFTEFYTDGTIAGKNTLTKQIVGPENGPDGISAGLQNPTRYRTGSAVNTGIGAYVKISDGRLSAKTYYIPAFIDLKGNKLENNSVIGVTAGASLTDNINISGFGEFNPSAKKGPTWTYGELNLEYKVNDNVSVSYNPALLKVKNGDMSVKFDNRVTFKYTFN